MSEELQFFNRLIDSPERKTGGHSNGHTNLYFVKAFELTENQKHVRHDKIPAFLSSGKQIPSINPF
ncbi:hypothetical protein Fmac_030838 [Flemingia macrophylla]|uniref:Uncharacterized protein n=1 Tax=Flemingia macrophylla TaxID=520843 RepID=A0ABD1L0B3_9FABA